jgi:hypothetical protein
LALHSSVFGTQTPLTTMFGGALPTGALQVQRRPWKQPVPLVQGAHDAASGPQASL